MPVNIIRNLGDGSNKTVFESDGTLQFTGNATVWNDLRIDAISARTGGAAPTDETGFRGNANFLARNFVNNQADEIQFQVQLDHSIKLNSTIYPHFHFSPWVTNAGTVNVKFIFEYYWTNYQSVFPVSPSTLDLTDTWTGDQRWYHRIAKNNTGISMTNDISSIMKCRLYRDNTVANNFPGSLTGLYFDIHFEVDTIGSRTDFIK